MQVVMILKALNDLTHALKGRKNVKGDAQIEALEKTNKLLNNIPRRITAEKEKLVTFDETTAPLQETNVRTRIPATKPKTTVQPSITKQSWTNQSHYICQLQGCSQARVPNRHNMQLRQQEQHECVQLIRDEERGEYLSYWQLI